MGRDRGWRLGRALSVPAFPGTRRSAALPPGPGPRSGVGARRLAPASSPDRRRPCALARCDPRPHARRSSARHRARRVRPAPRQEAPLARRRLPHPARRLGRGEARVRGRRLLHRHRSGTSALRGRRLRGAPLRSLRGAAARRPRRLARRARLRARLRPGATPRPSGRTTAGPRSPPRAIRHGHRSLRRRPPGARASSRRAASDGPTGSP